jgi:hypothetical protein
MKLQSGGEKEPLVWESEQPQAFCAIQESLVSAPALGLPDVRKPFFLYVHERSGMAIGVLTQFLGSWHPPGGLSLQAVGFNGKGMASLLVSSLSHSLAGILVSETEKLTLGGEITVRVPHSVVTLMEYQGQYWLTNARMVRYLSMLCENPQVKLEVVWTLNPVTHQLRGCVEVINEVFSSCPDLGDRPLAHPDLQLFTDGSSFLKKGTRHPGYAVLSLNSVL